MYVNRNQWLDDNDFIPLYEEDVKLHLTDLRTFYVVNYCCQEYDKYRILGKFLFY